MHGLRSLGIAALLLSCATCKGGASDDAEDSGTSTSEDDGPYCPIGAEGCPCTDAGFCDYDYVCEAGVCAAGDPTGDGDPAGDGDGDPAGDGDGEPAGDGDPFVPPDPTAFVDVGEFMIGTTEVRVQDYDEFLSAGVGFDMLPPECAWKDDYTPDVWDGQLQEGAERPVRWVDWCDAWAYCAWKGGHMCGLIGGQPATLADANDANVNEWFHACSNDDLSTYPYANLYQPDACNGLDAGVGVSVAVGTQPGCEGGIPGLFDMSGNVWEWTNACDELDVADDLQQCRRRGGSFASEADLLRCAVGSLRERSYRYTNTGIRCCG